MKKVITFGTFDVFHIGHVSILERAKSYGDYLIVGVSSDDLTFQKRDVNQFIVKEIEKKLLTLLVL
jgi:glycerol-3-phosphate cytidylyltransferase